jgi:hypothetical protein
MPSEITTLPFATLTEREERFAGHLAVYDDPAAAWIASGEVRPTTGRRSIQSQAYRMRALPHVAARIVELRNAIAANGPQATRAALVADLQACADVDVREIVTVTRHHCPACYSSPAYATAWPLIAAQALDSGSVDMPPQPLSVGHFDHTREPWADCAQCRGAGVAVTHWTPFDQLSPAARRLLRGVELYGDGSLKKVVIADGSQVREQLHRTIPGFYAPAASVQLNLHADIKPLKRGLTVEEALVMMEDFAPAATDALAAPVDDPTVMSEQ